MNPGTTTLADLVAGFLPEVPEIEVSEKCPECDGPMAVRQARGNYFLGCKKYPKCKGTREPSPEALSSTSTSHANGSFSRSAAIESSARESRSRCAVLTTQ